MQIESIDFNEFKPIIHDIVKEFLEEEKKENKKNCPRYPGYPFMSCLKG